MFRFCGLKLEQDRFAKELSRGFSDDVLWQAESHKAEGCQKFFDCRVCSMISTRESLQAANNAMQ